MSKKCTETNIFACAMLLFANLNLFLVWRFRCRGRRRLCLSFLVILSKFATCVTPGRIAKRSLVLLWSCIFLSVRYPDQRETKTGTNLAGRFRHRWISKAEVPLGRVFFSLLPTTWARAGGGGSLGVRPLLLQNRSFYGHQKCTQ